MCFNIPISQGGGGPMPGGPPAVPDFIRLLQKCRQEKNLGQVKQLHASILQHQLETHRTLGNHLVPALVECGALADARLVFDKLPHRSSHSWTALISAYVDCGQSDKALLLWRLMRQDHVQPNSYMYVGLLTACSRLHDLETGISIHAEITTRGSEGDLFVGSTLVDMYCKYGMLAEAQGVFAKLSSHDVVSWNALIAGYGDNAQGEEALRCFRQMRLEDVAPTVVTYVCCLKACSLTKALQTGQEVHSELSKRGLERQLYVGTTLLDMYACCNLLTEAEQMFDRLSTRDAVSWAALMSGYAQHGLDEEVLKCFKQSCSEEASIESVSIIHCLKACGAKRDLERGREVHAKIRELGLENDHFIINTLLDMYGKCGSITEAQEVFDKLAVRDVVSWNALMAGYADPRIDYQCSGLSSSDVDNEKLKQVFQLYQKMLWESIQPNYCTFIILLKSCSRLRDAERGRMLHIEVTKKGFETDIFVGNILVDMYGDCSLLAEARQVFKLLPTRDLVSWNALISGYVENGLAQESLNCFDKMQSESVVPSDVTFVCGLKACSSLGAIEKGRLLCAEIVKRGLGNNPIVESMMVVMYVKCGSFIEARNTFNQMPARNAVSWTALIADMTEYGFHEASDHLQQMHLEHVSPIAATFASSLKACGIVGALEAGQKMHTDLIKRGLETSVGNSLIDIYCKCGLLEEGRWVFDKLPGKDVISWTTMINGYGENHNSDMAIQFFENMQREGVKPNSITFTCLLASCSHASLISKGQEYLTLMKEHYNIEPTLSHYTLMVDLFARSGHILEAEKLTVSLQEFANKEEIWTALLSACKIHGEVEVGLRCFQQLVQMNQEGASAYLLMAEIYMNAGRWDDAKLIQKMVNHIGTKNLYH